ncbi:hypothetical protein HanPI659440_Chr04g0169931 [Helianthus annuus]|nr:hypothetical protein HanPI659440_Chr04g0169931 [Helianthus annuus]
MPYTEFRKFKSFQTRNQEFIIRKLYECYINYIQPQATPTASHTFFSQNNLHKSPEKIVAETSEFTTGITRSHSVHFALFFSHSLDLRRRNEARRDKGIRRNPCNVVGRSEKTTGMHDGL